MTAKEMHLYDLPDSRKVHTLPIPRLGGITFLPAATIAVSAAVVVAMREGSYMAGGISDGDVQHVLAFLCGAMMLYVIGFYDDVHGASYRVKFLVQILAAAALCISGLWVANFGHVFWIDSVAWWFGMPFTMLCVVYVTNAMNLIDGLDGLSSQYPPSCSSSPASPTIW